MGTDYVFILDKGDVVLMQADSMKEAYRHAIAFIIKDRRGALPDRGSVHPPALFSELREASNFFRNRCQIFAVNCYI